MTMRRVEHRTQRGVALLSVLAALVIVVTATVTVASVAASARLAEALNADTRRADDLLCAAKAPITN